MRNLKLIQPLLPTFLLAFLLALAIPSHATESDPYTNSDAFSYMRDSSSEINRFLNSQVSYITALVNREATPQMSDLEIETLWNETYRSKYYNSKLAAVAVGLEAIINENPVGAAIVGGQILTTELHKQMREDQNRLPINYLMVFEGIDRIVTAPNRSIYADAGFKGPTQKQLASIVKLCGIRVAADKFSHMLGDGFMYYQAARTGASLEIIHQYGQEHEKYFMGRKFTYVESQADVVANDAGVRFFTDLFQGSNPVIVRDTSTHQLVMRRKVDICDYVTMGWDETINPNSYAVSTEKQDRLQKAIEQRQIEAATRRAEMSESEHADWAHQLFRSPNMSSHISKMQVVGFAAKFLTTPKSRDYRESLRAFRQFSRSIKPKIRLTLSLTGTEEHATLNPAPHQTQRPRTRLIGPQE